MANILFRAIRRLRVLTYSPDVPLRPGETVIRSEFAQLHGYLGERQGRLVLTSERMAFVPSVPHGGRSPAWGATREVQLPDISCIGRTVRSPRLAALFPRFASIFDLVVECWDGRNYRFSVDHADEWISDIQLAINGERPAPPADPS